jgi:endonuclease/exonuclease/phosphatase family metal-dependent hydrolase
MSSRVRSFIVGVGLLALLAGARPQLSAGQDQEPQAKPRELRIMTYNIKHGQTNAECEQRPRVPGQDPFPDCNLNIEASIAVMRAHGADIVAVQEVDRFWARSAYLDEPAVIAAGLGMEHTCYAANLDHAPDSHSSVPHQYGTAIVSRFPILDCDNTLLPRTGNNEQRGLTRALINVRGVPLAFYNTHLHHTNAPDRSLQTVRIGEIMDATPGEVRVILGDFNARPNAAEMVPIFSRFVDAWQQAGAPTPDNPNGNTSPADVDRDPTGRIDYVFVSDHVDVATAYVPLNEHTRLAADHYPVVADIALPGSEVGIGRTEFP